MTVPTPTTDRLPGEGSAAPTMSPQVAAELCWHTTQLCRALDRGVADLQAALSDAAEQVDAILTHAVAAALVDQDDQASDRPRQARP